MGQKQNQENKNFSCAADMAMKTFSRYILPSLTGTFLAVGAVHSSAKVTDLMQCSLNGATRNVYIELENPDSAVPCGVMENKQISSPESAVWLWSAGDDPLYCKTKLDGYIEKLRGLGFDCLPGSD